MSQRARISAGRRLRRFSLKSARLIRPIQSNPHLHLAMTSAPATQSLSTGKQRVLDAAQTLFAEGSYGDIGVAQILERAGVQAPTLYHHFGDKEGLFVAWAEQAFGRVEQTVQANAGGANTIEALSRYGTALLSSIDLDLTQILRDAPRMQRPESRDRVLAAYMRAIYEPLASILVQAAATGELKNEAVSQLSDVFLGGLLALRTAQLNGDAPAKAAWWASAFVRGFAAERAVVYR
jgi:AcrR family transcriptional regulator